MREIVKVLLQEGIDESMINRVLDLIEEEYEVVDEGLKLGTKIYKLAKKKGLSGLDALDLQDKAEKVPSDHDYYVGKDGKIEGNLSIKELSKAQKGEMLNYGKQDDKNRDKIDTAFKKGKISQGKKEFLHQERVKKHDKKLQDTLS